MYILLEGMDNTGKTTLAQKLHETLNVPVVKLPNYRKVVDKNSYIKQLIDLLELSRKADFIVDRHPIISENVYGPILEKNNVLIQNPLWPELVEAFSKANPTIIYCRPPTAKIKAFGEREQMNGVTMNADKLILRYDALMEQLCVAGFRVYVYDWTHNAHIDDILRIYQRDRRIDQTQGVHESKDRALKYMLYCCLPATVGVIYNGVKTEAVVKVLINSDIIHAKGVVTDVQ